MRRSNLLTRISFFAVLMMAAGLLSAAGPVASVSVSGDVPTPQNYTLEDLQKFPVTKIHVHERDGTEAEYSGVLLGELLRRAGAPMGEQLRGRKALSKAVIVHAADQYQAVFSLAELDPAMAARPAVLTWSRNGEPLSSILGPLRLVVPDDKRQARWVRQVTAIEVVSVGSPAGTNAAATSITEKP
jgi:DMSO/TMAO reductase YedYZ molybdopterin-dependent catalytic subunit